jgi:hypothetical protein
VREYGDGGSYWELGKGALLWGGRKFSSTVPVVSTEVKNKLKRMSDLPRVISINSIETAGRQ